MALSPTTYARQTILAALKADTAVTAMVPKASIYPAKAPNPPDYPFIRYGSADALPQRAAGWKGGDVSGAVHVFVGQSDSIPDPEAWCGDAVDAMAEAIDAIEDCYCDRTQVIPDAEEPDIMHGLVFFTMKALASA
jgi:hypothetical protein